MEFLAKCVLYNIETKEKKEVCVKSIEDIKKVVTGDEQGQLTQINIDKYHKAYNSADNSITGIAGWIKTLGEYSEISDDWSEDVSREVLLSNEILFVLCNDDKPIDITEDALEFMISCLIV